MKNDEENQERNNWISAEMEARIVAWVSGDASPAESAELERLAAANPDVAAFKARIEVVRALAAEGISADKAPLRMSESRRAALLRELGSAGNDAVGAASSEAAPSLVTIQRRQQKERRWVLAAAACVTVGLFLSMMVPSFQKVRLGEMEREARESAIGLGGVKSREASKREAASVNFEVPPDDREVALAAPQAESTTRFYGAFKSEPRAASVNPAPVAIEMPKASGQILDEAEAKEADTASNPNVGRPFVSAAGGLNDGADKLAPGTVADAQVLDLKKEVASNAIVAGEQRPNVALSDKAEVETQAPIVLSPFVVQDEEDTGTYRASSTLAGTRVRPDLKDAASSISVVGSQFLQDTSAGDNQKVVDFKVGVETAGKTFAANSPVTGIESPSLAVLNNARQLSAASDQYYLENGISTTNVNALTNSGAHLASTPWDDSGSGRSIVFGTGSPAGIPLNAKAAGGAFPAEGGFGEVNASKDPVSTFSLHVSDVSFRLAQAALARGEVPDPSQIRPEEFYNAFNYGDPSPAMSEKVACHTEQSADPVAQQRNFLRIAMKVPSTGREGKQPLHLTLLVDTSGSMEREDRSQALQAAMKTLVSLLGREDRVTVIGFARSPRLLAEAVQGDKADALIDVIRRTPPDGGTNLEEAIKLGSELAQRHYRAGAQNRVVLLTDGAANLGDADPAHLAALVESLRQRGIAFDACGVGTGGIDDSVLETITRKGSGRYYVLDSPDAADAGFARQLAGAFRPAAENVKVQVRFNPSRVGNYRLIGFENHRLKQEDFRDDKVAAAALAGGEAAVALYEVEALPQGEGDLGEVHVRFRDTATGLMVERSWALPYDPLVPAFDKASPSMQLAGTAALLAEKLRGGARASAINLGQLAPVVNSLRNHYSHEVAVQELAAMYQQMRRIRGE
jgi:Ca-activated chloride channel family protein